MVIARNVRETDETAVARNAAGIPHAATPEETARTRADANREDAMTAGTVHDKNAGRNAKPGLNLL